MWYPVVVLSLLVTMGMGDSQVSPVILVSHITKNFENFQKSVFCHSLKAHIRIKGWSASVCEGALDSVI
jgi:hypothetical protein